MDHLLPSALATTIDSLSSRAATGLLCASTIALLAGSGGLGAQKSNGSNGNGHGKAGPTPAPSPEGYPSDLAVVERGMVTLGINGKSILETMRRHCVGSKSQVAAKRLKICRLLSRELGDQDIIVPAFLIGRHEVTNEQYEAFVRARKGEVRFPRHWWKPADIAAKRKEHFKKTKGKGEGFKPDDYWRANWRKLEWEVPAGKEKHPVTWVSFQDALGYCAWAGLRLPSEAEWQRALLGDKRQRYLWGNKWNKDWLKHLGMQSERTRKLRAVGSLPDARSIFGIDDMLANAWEWTEGGFRPFDGFKGAFHGLKRELERKKLLPPSPPAFDSSYRIVRGGSYRNRNEAPLVFRTSARVPLEDDQTVDDIGFRVAKTLQPALDTTVLKARREFNTEVLAGAVLDLPDRRSMRQMLSGKRQGTFEQIGIERWDLEGEVIRGHHMVSYVPVRELPSVPADLKKLRQISYENQKEGAFGLPIGALFTTEKISFEQDLRNEKLCDPGMYAIVYRAAGIPREIVAAMKAGRKELKAYKGKRKVVAERELAEKLAKKRAKETDAQRKRRERREAREKEKADKKRERDAKRKQGKSKRRTKRKDQTSKGAALDWYAIVDRFGIPDEVTVKGEKLREILIQPGDLKIPVDKDILIVRDHEGPYLYWVPIHPTKAVKLTSAKKASELVVDGATGKMTYVGGPQVGNKRFTFRVPFHLPVAELRKRWIRPDTLVDAVRATEDEGTVGNGKSNGAGGDR